MEKFTVYPAEPYKLGEFGTFGKASGMYLRQFQFPNTYSDKDKLVTADSDRCLGWWYEHANDCIKKYTKGGQMQLGGWIGNKKTTDREIIQFITEILKADTSVKWTGYRVLGTVGGSGHVVWTLQLFYKHPKSKTKVFTGPSAPNILSSPRKR